MAMVDAHYRVIMFDVGVNGRNSDAGVFASLKMASALENNTMNILPPRALPGRHSAVKGRNVFQNCVRNYCSFVLME